MKNFLRQIKWFVAFFYGFFGILFSSTFLVLFSLAGNKEASELIYGFYVIIAILHAIGFISIIIYTILASIFAKKEQIIDPSRVYAMLTIIILMFAMAFLQKELEVPFSFLFFSLLLLILYIANFINSGLALKNFFLNEKEIKGKNFKI